MAGSVQFVTRSRRVAQMPEWASEFTELVEHATESGLLAEVARRLRFSYKRGFGMLDLAVFFVALACSYSKGGIRGFRSSIQACAVRLAAISGRRCLPTSASVSRGLYAAERIADLDPRLAWVLSAGAHVQALCRSPLVQARDAHGLGWTVLDFDPSVTALRQRALPEDEDLPEPRRRAAPLCAPGHPGRHRGETQVSIAILSHTAAGLFVQASTHAGNTPFADALGIAAQAAAALVDTCDLPRDRTALRFDGAGAFVGELGAAPAQERRPVSNEPEPTVVPAQPETPAAVVEPPPADAPTERRQIPATSPLATHKPCPRGLPAPLHNIRQSNGAGCYAIYRMPAGLCWPCPQRAECTQSTNPTFRREFSVPLGVGCSAATCLAASLIC